MPSREWYAARAAERLRAHQAALPPEQRLINRTDWDDAIERKVSVLTRQAREKVKQSFTSTVSDPNVGMSNTPEEAENAYFRRGGKPFTNKVLRQFVKTIAITRTCTNLPSNRSLKKQVILLCSAARAAGNPVEHIVEKDTLLWIDGPLLTRGRIQPTAREKPTPLPQDIAVFLRGLFDRRFMTTLPTTRDILLIALFVCLEINCSTRAGDLLRPSVSKENLVAYNIEAKEKRFSWGSVEVLAFKQGSGQVSLQARLSFHCIKDAQEKTIALGLLPVNKIAQDALFWLMILGLIDGVFEGVSSWSDIDHLQPGPNGQIIPVKGRMRDVPVFRASTAKPSTQDDLIDKMQLGEQTMLIHLHKLSRFCGLKHIMLPNVLRRGSAYTGKGYAAGSCFEVAQRGYPEGSTPSWTNGGVPEGRPSVTSLVDDVPTHLYHQPPEGATRGELSTLFVDAFNHIHPADRFYPNQEPLPGTYKCRFCGLDFLAAIADGTEAAAHSQLCEAQRCTQAVPGRP